MYLHLAKRTRAARPLTNESQTSERVRIRTNMSMSGAARSAPCTRLRSSDVNEKCVRLDGSDVSQLRARDVESMSYLRSRRSRRRSGDGLRRDLRRELPLKHGNKTIKSVA